jgi:hypothetical protein
MKKSFVMPFGLTAEKQALFVTDTILSNKQVKEFEFYLEFDDSDEMEDGSVLLFVDDDTFLGVKLIVSSSQEKAKRYFDNLQMQ